MSRTQIDSSLVPAAATASANANICLANIQENFIDNGGMEVWQRGNTFTNPIAGTYQADRWQMNNNGNTASFVVSKETTITDGSPSSYKWALTSVGGTTVFRMRTTIEASQLAGKTVTVSARVRVDSGGVGFVFVDLNDVNGQTPFAAANATTLNNGTWETISVTRTLGANVTTLNFQFNFNNTPGVCYIDNIMGVIGSAPVSFVPNNPQAELARCQRYFTVFGGETAPIYLLSGACESSTIAYYMLRLPVQMRIIPTCVTNNTSSFQALSANGSAITCTSVIGGNASTTSVRIGIGVASGLVAGNASNLYLQNANGSVFISADF